MFASLIIERPQLEWALLPTALAGWLQDAGALAAIALVIVGLAYYLQRPAWIDPEWSATKRFVFAAASLSAVSYAIFIVLFFSQPLIAVPNPEPRLPPTLHYTFAQALFLTLGGGLALFAVTLPILLDVFAHRLVGRRIWALASVSLKEAWRLRIWAICLVIPIIYLYADWYITGKAEDQLRTRVGVAYFAMSLLFIITAVLLGSFSIPADVKNQTIHTIVTKPVQRYEIVLGRFTGYALLLLAELAAVTLLSLFYVLRGVSPEAAAESYHARVPLFANNLTFHGTTRDTRGESVGREWDYRSYIAGPGLFSERQGTQYAIWIFDELPAALSDRTEPVDLEFTFDIFRTTKGIEAQGVFCTFTFAPGQSVGARREEGVGPVQRRAH